VTTSEKGEEKTGRDGIGPGTSGRSKTTGGPSVPKTPSAGLGQKKQTGFPIEVCQKAKCSQKKKCPFRVYGKKKEKKKKRRMRSYGPSDKRRVGGQEIPVPHGGTSTGGEKKKKK